MLKATGKYYNNIIVSLCWSCVECSQIVYCVELWLGIGTCQLSSHHTGPVGTEAEVEFIEKKDELCGSNGEN